MKKTFLVIVIIIAFGILHYLYIQKPWMLSIYANGSTLAREFYASKTTCLSAGNSYLVDKTADRFDCGYKCYGADKSSLSDSPICKEVCNSVGCRQ